MYIYIYVYLLFHSLCIYQILFVDLFMYIYGSLVQSDIHIWPRLPHDAR